MRSVTHIQCILTVSDLLVSSTSVDVGSICQHGGLMCDLCAQVSRLLVSSTSVDVGSICQHGGLMCDLCVQVDDGTVCHLWRAHDRRGARCV